MGETLVTKKTASMNCITLTTREEHCSLVFFSNSALQTSLILQEYIYKTTMLSRESNPSSWHPGLGVALVWTSNPSMPQDI